MKPFSCRHALGSQIGYTCLSNADLIGLTSINQRQKHFFIGAVASCYQRGQVLNRSSISKLSLPISEYTVNFCKHFFFPEDLEKHLKL